MPKSVLFYIHNRRQERLTRSRQKLGQEYIIFLASPSISFKASGSLTPCFSASSLLALAASASLLASSTSHPKSSWKKRRLGWIRTKMTRSAHDSCHVVHIHLTIKTSGSTNHICVHQSHILILHHVGDDDTGASAHSNTLEEKSRQSAYSITVSWCCSVCSHNEPESCHPSPGLPQSIHMHAQ